MKIRWEPQEQYQQYGNGQQAFMLIDEMGLWSID